MSKGGRSSGGRKVAIAFLLVPVLLLGFLLGIVFTSDTSSPACNPAGTALVVDPGSVPQGPVAGYDHEQLVNAAHVMLAAQRLGLTVRDQQIGVMTAMGESTLRVLDYGDAVGPDSRGLFQQRANGTWGSYTDRMDPFTSSTSFFNVEMTITGRESMEPTLVAHAVQRNADPYHYEPFWAPAGAVVQALGGIKAQANAGAAPAQGNGQPARQSAYSLGPVQPQTATVANTLGPRFGFKTVGGYRAGGSRDPQGHPAGLALDFMTTDIADGKATGDRLAAYLTEHHADLGVKYVIWYQRMWSVQRADEGWRPMADRGSPTQNHMDHVHLSLDPNATVDAESLSAAGCAITSDGPVAATGWARPSNGPLGSPYGWRLHPIFGNRRFHFGQDMGPGCDAPIWAANKGQVVRAGVAGGYGNLIEIDHGNGIHSRYGHMYNDGVLVKVGEQVTAGHQIGTMGSNGNSTGCHLHFEVLINGEHVDPTAFLDKVGVTINQ